MIIELTLFILLITLLILLNKYSTLIALIICICLVYYFVRYFSRAINSQIIARLIAKIWMAIVLCFTFWKQIYFFCKRLLSMQKQRSTSKRQVVIKACGDSLDLEREIDVLVQNISQHYINFWYNKISENEDFVIHLNNSMRITFYRLCTSLSKLETKEFSYIICQIYIHYFTHFIEAKKSSKSAVAKNFQMKHWAMKDSLTEWCYIQSLVSALLNKFGPNEINNSYNSKYSSLIHTIIVEILTETLIGPLVRLICSPLRINLLILGILSNLLNTDKITGNTNSSSKTELIAEETTSTKNATSNVTSKNLLSVPISYSNVSQKIDLENCKESPNRKMSSASMLRSSSIRSSSNSYLSNYNCNDLKTECKDESTSCHDNLIKRSKSADFIRHMPQLKAFNDKEYDIKLLKENNTILIALKYESSPNFGVEQAEEAIAVEIPTLFTDVKITDTVQQNEDGILPYTLYCIQYSGIFHDVGSPSDTPQLVTQVVSIKRRFSEFVTLHSRLEDNPDLKYYIKGIKGPSKWLTLPFSNLDKKYIAERKVFLEGYLKELCSSAPIAHSAELQEFLAYGGDARISFVKRTGDIIVPRIDKILVRGVKGAIDIFKTALPLSSSEVEGILPIKTCTDDSTSPEQRFNEHLLDFSSREPEIKEHIKNYFRNSIENLSFNSVPQKLKSFDLKVKRSSLLRNLSNFKVEESCDCSEELDNFSEKENPFGVTIIELMDAVVNFNAMNLGDIRTKLVLSLAPVLNKCIADKLEGLSEEQIASVLHSLHQYLWPSEISVSKPNTYQENLSTVDKVIECLETLLSSQNFLHNEIYSFKTAFLEKIKLFLLSLQHEELNKCLLYHIFDVLIEFLCFKE